MSSKCSPEGYPSDADKQVMISAPLHKRLRVKAAQDDKTMKEIAEEHLWPVVGGKPPEPSAPNPE